MNRDVWDATPERFCPDCYLVGIKTLLSEKSTCPVHGLVAPMMGELEVHAPDPKKIASTIDPEEDEEDTDDGPEKLYEGEEFKMLTDPETFPDDRTNDDNKDIEDNWFNLAGDG